VTLVKFVRRTEICRGRQIFRSFRKWPDFNKNGFSRRVSEVRAETIAKLDRVVFKNSISLKRWLRIAWFSGDRIRG
jgi:hypothetical protein